METIGKATVTLNYQQWGELQSALHMSKHIVSREVSEAVQSAYEFSRELEADIQRANDRKRAGQ